MKINPKEWLSLKEATKLIKSKTGRSKVTKQYTWQLGQFNKINTVTYWGVTLYSVDSINKFNQN